jgi:hypothetical protein
MVNELDMRVPAWICYSDKYEEFIWDLVEVKKSYLSERIDIGVRGIGYAMFDYTEEKFVQHCASMSMHFVTPHNPPIFEPVVNHCSHRQLMPRIDGFATCQFCGEVVEIQSH